MDTRTIEILVMDLKRFFSFAQELNRTVTKRISAMNKLDAFTGLAGELLEKNGRVLEQALAASTTLRGHITDILNDCLLLELAANRQKDIIHDLKILEAVDDRTEKKLMFRILMTSESLQKGILLTRAIMERTARMVLVYRQLILQRGLMNGQLTLFSEDLKNLHANLDAGMKEYDGAAIRRHVSEEFPPRAGDIIESFDAGAIPELLDEIRLELRAEESLAANLSPRLKTAEEVALSARRLYHDSSEMQNLTDEKNACYSENLEDMAQLSVILSLELGEYGKLRELIQAEKIDAGAPHEIRQLYRRFFVLFDLSTAIVDELAAMNQSMVETFDAAAGGEDQVSEFSTMDIKCHDDIRKEIESAARMLHHMSDGARKNIIIGQVLEKNLVKMQNSISR